MYVITLARGFSSEANVADAYMKMVEWSNNLAGTDVRVAGYEEGVVESVRSLDSISMGLMIIASAVVSVKETGPIVEEDNE